MVSVSDILKILDNVPLLRRLRAVPDELDTLKARMDALEAQLASPPVAPGETCDKCGHAAVRLTASEPDKTRRGFFIDKQTWTCGNCGMVSTRHKQTLK